MGAETLTASGGKSQLKGAELGVPTSVGLETWEQNRLKPELRT